MQVVDKSLFALMQDRVSINQIIEALEGDLTPEVEKALELNREQLSMKAEGYIVVLEQLQSFIELNERYISQASDNIARAERAVSRLKGNLLNAAKSFGAIQAGVHKVTTRKSTSVEITDEAKIPPEYTVTKINTVPDKRLIADSLKDGVEIPGASLRESVHLKIG